MITQSMVLEYIKKYYEKFTIKHTNHYLVDLHSIAESIDYKVVVTSRYFKDIFRARKLYHKNLSLGILNNEYNHAKKFGPTPEKKVTNEGRCNLIGESCAYFGLDNGTPVFEVRPQENDYIALSKFYNFSNSEMSFGIVGGSIIILNINLNNGYRSAIDDKLYKFLINQPSCSIEAILKRYDTENHCKRYAFDYLLGRVFAESNENAQARSFLETTGQSLYAQTNKVKEFISNNFSLDNSPKIQGIAYPSVQGKYYSLCYCCEPIFFDQIFTFDQSIVYKVVKAEGSNFKLQPIFEGNINDNKGITWKKCDPNLFWTLTPESPISEINI